MRTGSEIVSKFPVGSTAKEQEDREALILNSIRDKEFPYYLGNQWSKISKKALDKNGVEHDLVLFVSPRHIELGVEGDSFLAPMWPETAQEAVNSLGAILPSRLIVDYIWEASGDNRIQIGPPKGFVIPGIDMEKTPSWVEHNRIIQEKLGSSNELFVDGKKDVVVGPNLDGSKVAIYSGPFNPKGKLREYSNGIPLHQPYSTIHGSKYSDYSHGIRAVSRQALIDDKTVDIVDLFTDPVLHTLVSDQGPFDPVFPNNLSRTSLSDSFGFNEPQEPSVDPVDPLDEKDKSHLVKWALPVGIALGIFVATINIEKIRKWLSP